MRIPFLSAKPKKPPVVPPDPVEDDEPEESDPSGLSEERRAHILAAWLLLKTETDRRLKTLSGSLASGDVDNQAWGAHVRVQLTAAHSHAHAVGRNLAGDLGAYGRHDSDGGEAAWERQEPFFQNFEKDLADGRYTTSEGKLNRKGFDARTGAFLAAIRGTASESFRVAMVDEPLEWLLGGGDHCGPSPDFPYDCPSLSEEEPKPASQWSTAPGRGDCPCLSRCTCELKAVDGSYSTQGL